MSKVIKVRFKENQGAEDIFISTGIPKKVYIRQPAQNKKQVVWTTATKAGIGYEASSPLKAGVSVCVIKGGKKEKTTVFTEVMEAQESSEATFAEKAEPFSYEHLAGNAKICAADLHLHPYEDWSRWLLSDCEQYHYTGYPDNWLHFGTSEVSKKTIETLDIMGAQYPVVETIWKHKINGRTWKVIEITDAQGNTVELCGYGFPI